MRVLIILLAILFLGNCKDQQGSEYKAISDNFESKTLKGQQEHAGKKLMEINCYICHSPTASEIDRVAPPMIAIKKRYIFNDTTKEDFKKEMQDFIKNPNEKNAKMFGAVRRFGVMPKMIYPEKTIDQIADYMFDNAIEQPEWFEEHYNRMRGNRSGMKKGMERK